MSQLEQEIKALEEQETIYTNEIERIAQSDPFDSYQHSALKGELDTVQDKLAALRSEQSAETKVEVESFEKLTMPGTTDEIPLAYLLSTDLIPLEEKMTIITAALQNKLANAASVKASLERQIDSMQDRLDDSEAENKLLYQGKKELELVVNDLETKLHNASKQIEEYKAADDHKESEITKLREQLSKNAQPVDAKIESNESVQEALAKRPAIYNVRWEPVVGPQTHKLANLAETDEEIRYHYFNEGIYRILDKEELLQFRKEKEDRDHQAALEAERLDQEALANTPLVNPPLFIPSGEGTEHGLAEGNTGVEGAGEAVTRAEHEALAARVAFLEQQSQRSVA
ncbi:hypothetical protein [Paenibacillus sinopodophylli]|uniref:hypothetical protein n=1 Tax=Paenibacillus sinopodophylli TaxID=1837342 RepID=UPI00110D1F37|nr:hypothetical protein [Paenibacillus sinopodophylli]